MGGGKSLHASMFFVNGGERAVKATSNPPIIPVLKYNRQSQRGEFALNSVGLKLERFESRCE